MGVKTAKKGQYNMNFSNYWTHVYGNVQIHTSHAACARQIFYWMHGNFTGMYGKFTGLHSKFTGCMTVASAHIIRVHVLHGANGSWSVKKKIHAS